MAGDAGAATAGWYWPFFPKHTWKWQEYIVMKNRNSNNNKFHHRCQHLLNYNLLLQTYNSFFGANYVFARHNWC